MELHFCSVCGISIPQSEIEREGLGDGGKVLCSEHRPARDTTAAPAKPVAKSSATSLDVELLFCANCRVSIPESDARSGRAHREFGSLLCTVCSKADPGERAARRDAVEAELADTDGDDDLLRPARMAVAMSSPSSPPAASREGSSVGSIAVALIVVGLVFAGIGWGLGSTLSEGNEEQIQQITQLKGQSDTMSGEIEALKLRVANADRSRNDSFVRLREDGEAGDAQIKERIRSEVEESLRNARENVATLKGELTGSDARLESRIAKIEGQIEGISEMLKVLGNRPAVAPPVDPPTKTSAGDPPPTGGDPVKPVANPRVAQLIRDLLESQEEADRFPAATELGKLGDETAIPSLAHALINDSHYLVRRACARSLGTLRAWYAVPSLITALEEKESYVAQQANFALQAITGEDFGVSQDMSVSQRRSKAKAALKWWEKSQGSPPPDVSLQLLN